MVQMKDGRLAVSVDDAAEMLGIRKSLAWELVRRGDLPSFRIGKRRLVRVTELEAFIERAAAEAAQEG